MKKIWIFALLVAVLTSGTFFSCSSKKESEETKGAVERMTDKTAKEMVDHLQAPIKKAREAAKQGDERVKELDENLKKQ